MPRLRELLPQLRVELEAAADPQKAAEMSAYMKGHFEFFGVQTPERRRLSKPALAAGADCDHGEILDFAEACWRQREREFHYVGADVLRRWAKVLGPGDLDRVERLLRTNSWWDTVDSLAVWTIGPLVASYPELVRVMDQWIDDDNIWIARTAILHQLAYKELTDRDRLFSYVEKRADDSDFFIRKALGWALRQYARTEPDAVRAFVDRLGTRLSALTRREALKHIDR
jgi:3-methyladenine DNA glycosylase AlkD